MANRYKKTNKSLVILDIWSFVDVSISMCILDPAKL